MACARRCLGEAQLQRRRRGSDLVQDREGGCHDFGPDAVAGQDGDVEAVIGEHAMLSPDAGRVDMPFDATIRWLCGSYAGRKSGAASMTRLPPGRIPMSSRTWLRPRFPTLPGAAALLFPPPLPAGDPDPPLPP